MNSNVIQSINYDQKQIIKDIIKLHCPNGIELDPTYSKGTFYKGKNINQPFYKFDLYPQTEDTLQANANNLPHANNTINSIMFDPPFIVGLGKKDKGIIAQRFGVFKDIKSLWHWYSECLNEFYRILKPNGILIVKCQDTINSGKQYFSHVYLMNEAQKIGFYNKDLFVLLAKNRLIGANHKVQYHARKFHSYFIVLKKAK